MGRLRLGAITAVTLTAIAGPAAAAEITRVATRGEPGNPFDLHLSVAWERSQQRAQITREVPAGGGAGDPGGVVDGDEMRYSRTVNAIVARAAIGLTEDLDIHFEMPWVLGDERSWRFGTRGGQPTGGVPGVQSSIETNTVDAEGLTCGTTPCPLFLVAPSTSVFLGGKAGDLKVGVDWGIFSDKKDPTKPYWLVGVDVTFPTAKLYDPVAGRRTNWSSPYFIEGEPGPLGEKVWKWDFHTILSRRLGPVDPYVKAHATLMTKSSSTYSNCDHAAELASDTALNPTNPVVRQMTRAAAANCQDKDAAKDAEAQLPWIAGLTFGSELVPYESETEGQKVSIDLRVFADYTSSARFYNELTDASGKLHKTGEYLTVGGFFGLYLRASRYVSLHATASLSTRTSHFLTGESLGRNGSWPALFGDNTDPQRAPSETANRLDMNPNFDWRYDAPGRRFRLSEVALFELTFGGLLQF